MCPNPLTMPNVRHCLTAVACLLLIAAFVVPQQASAASSPPGQATGKDSGGGKSKSGTASPTPPNLFSDKILEGINEIFTLVTNKTNSTQFARDMSKRARTLDMSPAGAYPAQFKAGLDINTIAPLLVLLAIIPIVVPLISSLFSSLFHPYNFAFGKRRRRRSAGDQYRTASNKEGLDYMEPTMDQEQLERIMKLIAQMQSTIDSGMKK